MRSTNMLERVNQEIERRTRVIRIFPNEQACVRLVSTLMMELNQESMERVYLNRGGEHRSRRSRGGSSSGLITVCVPGSALHYGSESNKELD